MSLKNLNPAFVSDFDSWISSLFSTPKNTKIIIKILLSRRLFQKYKLLNKYITIAIDGTGLFTYSDKEPYPGCPNKVSKTVKKTYFQSVVEAKIVGKN